MLDHQFPSSSLSRCSRCGVARFKQGKRLLYSINIDGPWREEIPACAEPPVEDPWYGHEILMVDVETTGLSWMFDEVTEVGAVVARIEPVEDDFQLTIVESFSSLVRPRSELRERAIETQEITGITWEMLEDAPSPREVATRLAEIGSRYPNALMAAYNGHFDAGFVCGALFLRSGVEVPPVFRQSDYLDPCVWSRKIDKYKVGGHKLVTVAERREVLDKATLEQEAHRADFDAEVALRVMLSFAKVVPKELVDLQHWQRASREEWRENFFGVYLPKKRREERLAKLITRLSTQTS